MKPGVTLDAPETDSAAEPMNRRFEPAVAWFVRLGLGSLVVVNVLVLVAAYWWFADLFAHFQLQYFCAAIVVCGGALYARRYRLAGVAGLLIVLHGAALAPYLIPSSGTDAHDNETLSLLQWNVYIGNRSYSEVTDRIRELRPDFVLLEEVSPKLADALEGLRDDYPFQRLASTGAPFGIAFLSRQPLESVVIRDDFSELRNVVTAKLPGGVTLFGVHVISPVGGRHSAWRNRQLRELAELVRRTDGPVVVAGDLNVSPFSPHHRKLLESAHLLDARVGRGLLNSWPGGIAPLRIPIDQLLYSSDVEVDELVRPGTSGHSDHFPLLCRFQANR